MRMRKRVVGLLLAAEAAAIVIVKRGKGGRHTSKIKGGVEGKARKRRDKEQREARGAFKKERGARATRWTERERCHWPATVSLLSPLMII
jgi:hypothetical protein